MNWRMIAMSIADIEAYKKAYPEQFSTPAEDIFISLIIFFFTFVLFFLALYLYARFLEPGLVTSVRNRLIPFIRFRLHLNKLINFIDHVLKTRIFGDG